MRTESFILSHVISASMLVWAVVWWKRLDIGKPILCWLPGSREGWREGAGKGDTAHPGDPLLTKLHLITASQPSHPIIQSPSNNI